MCTIEKDKIKSFRGIPYPPRWFADNRIAFQAVEEGLGDIDYFSAAAPGHYKAFLNSFWGGMRFYINTGTHNYLLKMKECEVFPFGMKGSCKAGESEYSLTFFAAEDTVFILLKTSGQGSTGSRFQTEFYKTYCMRPQGTNGDLRYKSHIKREWMEFELKNRQLSGGFTEENATTGICFGSSFPLSFRQSRANTKYMLTSGELCADSEYVLAIAFDTSPEKSCRRAERSVASYLSIWEKQLSRYQSIAERAPVLTSPYEQLNHFVAMAPLYHESLKVTDVPGAIRAQTTHYWMWGWDSLTSNDAALYWGDRSFIGDMLSCFQKYSGSHGVAHAFNRDMTCGDEAAPPAQGMYITLLYLYHCNGGSINEFYPFAKNLFQKILASESENRGLCDGTSLYPDYRGLINETGNDISAFNNTVGYCAARAMEALADIAGDKETQTAAGGFAKRLRQNFLPVLFNKTLKFIDSSADSITLEPRNVPTNNAVKWENNFCGELTDDVKKECLDFYLKHLVTTAGIRPIPSWCEVYDNDANQLSCWWTVMSEFYCRLINEQDCTEQIDQFAGWIGYWTEKLMCPEGISCYNETSSPPVDNWNCMNGIWHAYSIRGWYTALIHSIFGVDLDEGGLTAYPYSGKEMQLSGLHFGDKTFDISMCGSGRFVRSIEINGKTVLGTNKIPFDLLGDKNKVIINRRGETGCFSFVKKAYAVKITDYSFTERKLTAVLTGCSSKEIVIQAEKGVVVTLNDRPVTMAESKDGSYKIQVDFCESPSVKFTCKKGS